jgi:hypothetical protein
MFQLLLERKLRCNGEKPLCNNCTIRNFECVYALVQRRRGPGKAQKGSHSKKARATRCLELKPGYHPSASSIIAELDAMPPEILPYVTVLQDIVVTQ